MSNFQPVSKEIQPGGLNFFGSHAGRCVAPLPEVRPGDNSGPYQQAEK